jgi:transcriptional regulator with XRE-family HTH domain
MSVLRRKFGGRLRDLRNQQNITQEELAERLEVTVEFVSNMERGINAPSFETLERLTHALSISYKDLFDFKDDT